MKIPNPHAAFMAFACALFAACSPQQPFITSPDGRIAVSVEADAGAGVTYAVTVDDKPLILPSAMGLAACGTSLQGATITGVWHSSHDGLWTAPWGENKRHRNHYNEMSVAVRKPDKSMAFTLRFRAFDDGIAFRYELAQPDSLAVTDELTEFRFADEGHTMSWSIPGNFETYELQYREQPVARVTDANTPFTFRTGDGIFGAVHEAALYDWPEMVLRRDSAGVLKAALAPLPDGVKAYIPGRFTTPWRTIQIADRAVGLINSSLVLNLNEPSKIEDTSWIVPQKYVGVWWGMHLGTQVWTMGPRHGATTRNAIRHIDFAAENGIQGVLFEGWNKGWENWGGNQQFDYLEPYADFDLERIAAYAREKGVQLWMHNETGGNIPEYEAVLEAAMRRYAELGVHTLKTGYAGGIQRRLPPSFAVWSAALSAGRGNGGEIPDHARRTQADKGDGDTTHVAQHDDTRRGAGHGMERMVGREFGRVSHDAALREDAERTDGLHSGNLRHRLFHSEGRQGTDRVERAQRGMLHKDHAGTADSKLGDHILAPADGRRPDRELRRASRIPVLPRLRRRLRLVEGIAGRDRRLYRRCKTGQRQILSRGRNGREGKDARAEARLPRTRSDVHRDDICRCSGCGAQSGGIPDREAGGDGTRYHTHRDG